MKYHGNHFLHGFLLFLGESTKLRKHLFFLVREVVGLSIFAKKFCHGAAERADNFF